MVARFKADRDDQYREFLGKRDAFEAEIAKEVAKKKYTYAEREEEGNDLNNFKTGWKRSVLLNFIRHLLLLPPRSA